MTDISIISPCCKPANLARLLDSISNQSCDGINFELILIIESNGLDFSHIHDPLLNRAKIFRTKINYDYGASSKDLGLLHATGEYILFWDDDNIYYKHAIVSQYVNASGFDIGISRAYHLHYTIPQADDIRAGDIDTMNVCIRKDLAKKCSWQSMGTKYSDYIYISKLLEHKPTIRYSNAIIGHHL